eukprot:g1113.t1
MAARGGGGNVVVPRNFKLLQELEDGEKGKALQGSPHSHFISFGIENPSNPDIFLHHWHATIIGPQNTPLGERIYSLKIYCSDNYPSEPPSIKFQSAINMPCVNQSNGVVDPRKVPQMSQRQWSRNSSIAECLVSIREQMTAAARLQQPPDGQQFP